MQDYEAPVVKRCPGFPTQRGCAGRRGCTSRGPASVRSRAVQDLAAGSSTHALQEGAGAGPHVTAVHTPGSQKALQAPPVIYFHELMAIKGPYGGPAPECLMSLGRGSQQGPVKGTGLVCLEQAGAALILRERVHASMRVCKLAEERSVFLS